MKKRSMVLVSLILVFSFALLTACGGGGSSKDLSDSKYVGTWVSTGMSLGEETGELSQEVFLTVKGDGTGEMTSPDEEPSAFTWSPVDGGFKTKGDLKTTFKDEENGIVTKVIGVELHFVKTE